MPKFSILISAYNAEKYIEECLDSVCNQNFQDYELIVIDDGSTDRTNAICKRYIQKNNRIILYHWKNHGLILARRKGISMAQGEYILFLDADDHYLDNSLQKLNDTLNVHENPDIMLFRFLFTYEKGHTKESRDFGVKTYSLSDNILERERLLIDTASYYEYNHLWCKAIRRDLILQDQFDYERLAGIQLGEDLLQTVPLMTMAKRVVVVSDVLYGYRITQTSMAHFFKEKQLTDINKVYELIIMKILTQIQSRETVKKAFYDAYMTKICSLMRTLWESNMKTENKVRITRDILSFSLLNGTNNETTQMPIQNKIFYILARKGMWRTLGLYSKITKAV